MLTPYVLGPNFVPQSYPGGGAVGRFRGIDPAPTSSPEDWVASVTERFGAGPHGLTILPDGRSLKDAIAEDPEDFLSPAHRAAFGTDVGLLVKLLDSSKRLVVHSHPDRDFARSHLGCAHGKTEAWAVLEARPGAEVYLAFKHDVDRGELGAWVAEQRVDEMLASLHALSIAAGAAVLIPAGVPHAIGDGILVLELQEPTDFSVMLEQGAFADGDLNLGWDLALDSVDRHGWSDERVGHLLGPGTGTGRGAGGRVFPAAADPFFRAEVIRGDGGETEIAEGFAVAVVVAGTGSFAGDFPGTPLGVAKGDTVLLPYGAGPIRGHGDVEVVVCRPPVPGALRPSRPEL
jgi:mannose-6-phosphate isomerase